MRTIYRFAASAWFASKSLCILLDAADIPMTAMAPVAIICGSAIPALIIVAIMDTSGSEDDQIVGEWVKLNPREALGTLRA